MLNGKLSVYERIVQQIKRDIALGIIAEGEKLPSCRELAHTMGINPNTVQRAYSALEEEGLIYTLPKKGVYAHGDAAACEAIESAKTRRALEEAERQLLAIKQAGITREQLEEILSKIYTES